jgi:hypothetical protein
MTSRAVQLRGIVSDSVFNQGAVTFRIGKCSVILNLRNRRSRPFADGDAIAVAVRRDTLFSRGYVGLAFRSPPSADVQPAGKTPHVVVLAIGALCALIWLALCILKGELLLPGFRASNWWGWAIAAAVAFSGFRIREIAEGTKFLSASSDDEASASLPD